MMESTAEIDPPFQNPKDGYARLVQGFFRGMAMLHGLVTGSPLHALLIEALARYLRGYGARWRHPGCAVPQLVLTAPLLPVWQ